MKPAVVRDPDGFAVAATAFSDPCAIGEPRVPQHGSLPE